MGYRRCKGYQRYWGNIEYRIIKDTKDTEDKGIHGIHDIQRVQGTRGDRYGYKL